jgi:parallel beta-helix repeat protein
MIIINPPLARTWYVDDDFRDCPNADFNRIQDAIDAASPGDTVKVCPGTYKESLVITKTLTLSGSGYERTTIQVGREGMKISGSFDKPPIEVIVEGFKIMAEIVGIYIGYNVRPTVRNNYIYGEGGGIHLRGVEYAVIENNYSVGGSFNTGIEIEYSQVVIRNNRFIGGTGAIWVGKYSRAVIEENGDIHGYWGTSSIYIHWTSQATIEKNNIRSYYEVGIWVERGGEATIQGNSIFYNGCGIRIFGRAVILNNTFWDNKVGIGLESGVATIQGNTISKSWSSAIGATGYCQAIIQGNTISENGGYAIGVGDYSQVTILENQISGNDGGGIFISGSAQVTIEGNAIIDNGKLLRYGYHGYGVMLNQRPCVDTDRLFEGVIRGKKNTISGNQPGNVCPAELEFLMTEAGGCYGPKC